MMLEPDVELGRRFIEKHQPPGRVLVCAVTGSHHYGFPSPDSDLDLKGIHLAPTASLLGLRPAPETHDRLLEFDGVECDLTTHEIQKALSLLLRGNGNMLERIHSPFQLFETPERAELVELSKGALSKRFFSHYRGFFKGICHEHEKLGQRHGKSLLYAYRVALTGVHLLNTGEVIGNLIKLSSLYGFPEAEMLAQRKIRTAEKVVLSEEEDALHRAAWPRLNALLEEAHQKSFLPDAPKNEPELNNWLTNLRLRDLEPCIGRPRSL